MRIKNRNVSGCSGACHKKQQKKGSGQRGLFRTVLLGMALMIISAQPVFATSVVTGKINNLYSLVLGIIKAAGAIVLAWGVFEFAAGYQSHDSSQQTQSLKKVISGILMCAASTVIGLVK